MAPGKKSAAILSGSGRTWAPACFEIVSPNKLQMIEANSHVFKLYTSICSEVYCIKLIGTSQQACLTF